MRRWFIILLLMLVLLSASGVFLLWRLPRLLEVSPAPGTQRVSAVEPLRLRFSRCMHTTSVATHLQIDPGIEGSFSWEEDTIIFTPDTPWPSGITVTVQLNAGVYTDGFPPLPTTDRKIWSFTISKPLLAYLWPANPPADIYALDPVSGDTLRLTEGVNVQDFSVSANGTTLYYSAITEAGKADIYQLKWRDSTGEGGQTAPLQQIMPNQNLATCVLTCPDANCRTVQISPSEEYLAYERTPVLSPGQLVNTQVWLLPLSGGEPFQVGNPAHERILPDWSPSDRLAYYDKTIQAFILFDPRTQETRTFPNQTGEQGCWTADGQSFVTSEITFVPVPNAASEFSVPELPTSHLLRFDWTTEQIYDLTGAADLEDAFPACSPDGKQLAFARRSLDPTQWTIGRQLWLAEGDGKNAHPLLNADLTALDSYSHYDFAWKPDSSQLSYVRSNQDYPLDPPELWLVDANGLNRVQLVVGGYAPQWVR